GPGLEERHHGALEGGGHGPQPRPASFVHRRVVKREPPGLIGLHHAIDTRARTEQHGRNLAWPMTRRTQQEQVQRQQIAIASAPQFGQHAGLLRRRNIHYRYPRHGRSSLIAQEVSQLLMYQRVLFCANLLWFDLASVFLSFLSEYLSSR